MRSTPWMCDSLVCLSVQFIDWRDYWTSVFERCDTSTSRFFAKWMSLFVIMCFVIYLFIFKPILDAADSLMTLHQCRPEHWSSSLSWSQHLSRRYIAISWNKYLLIQCFQLDYKRILPPSVLRKFKCLWRNLQTICQSSTVIVPLQFVFSHRCSVIFI